MAEALRLEGVAREKGFQLRIRNMLFKRALVVVAEAVPDAAELVVAKALLAGTDSGIVERFCTTLVADDTVSTALANNKYDHTAVADTSAEPRMLAVFTDSAKAYV